MTFIKGQYQGNLRCELSHPSDTIIQTDAPKDNRGEGKYFSPTDLLAASLVSCMLTILAIRARDRSIEIGKPKFEVEKIMGSNPRRISGLKIKINFFVEVSLNDRSYLENEARNCPVALSISDSIDQQISFEYA